MDQKLTPEEKKYLLNLSRNTLNQYIQTRKITLKNDLPANLMQKRAAFVMLYDGLEPRGTSGTFEKDHPLGHVIQNLTIEAGVSDPTQLPVQPGEIKRIKIKIKVLSQFKIIKDIASIELGTHGLYFTLDNKRAYLFSAIAIEKKWNVDIFLSELCNQAGLHRHAWQDKRAKVWTFEEDNFSD